MFRVHVEAYFCVMSKGSRKVRFSGGYNVYVSSHLCLTLSLSANARLTPFLSPLAENPFNFWGKVIDCGDIPVTS